MAGHLSVPDQWEGMQRSLEGIHWPYLNCLLCFSFAGLTHVDRLSGIMGIVVHSGRLNPIVWNIQSRLLSQFVPIFLCDIKILWYKRKARLWCLFLKPTIARFASGARSNHFTANQNDLLMFFYNDGWKFCLWSAKFPLSNKLQKPPEIALELHGAPQQTCPGGHFNGLAVNPEGTKWNLPADNELVLGMETSRGSLETVDRLVWLLQGVSRSGELTWFSRELRAPAGWREEERSLVSAWLL